MTARMLWCRLVHAFRTFARPDTTIAWDPHADYRRVDEIEERVRIIEARARVEAHATGDR